MLVALQDHRAHLDEGAAEDELGWSDVRLGANPAGVQRRLAAIFVADVVGYSRLMSDDEAGTFDLLRARRAILERLIAEHGGRVANTAGDSVLAEFRSVVDSVECALKFQTTVRQANADVSEARAMWFRIGLHLGDVLVHRGDVLGDGVNIAARLEQLADPGGVCLSGSAYQEVEGKLPVAFEDRGEHQLKNLSRPIKVYALSGPARSDGGAASPPPLPDKPSIAVLPFTNMSGDPEQDYFADGVVEDITTGLARIRWLFVIARNSSFTYKGKAVDVRQVGRELGVRYVLEGSIRRAGRRLRITGQLVEAASGSHIWADKFDGDVEDVFDLQDRITEAVVGAIEPSLRRAEVERAKSKPGSLGAYDLYLRALPDFYRMTEDGFAGAIAFCERSLAVEPSFIAAKALASYIRAVRISYGQAEPGDQEIAVRLAREVAGSPTDDPEALRRVAHVLGYNAKAYEEALGAVTRSLELNPNSAPAYNSSGWIRLYVSEPKTAEEHFRRAIRLSPVDPERGMATTGLAVSYLMRGRHAEGLGFARQAVREMPQYPSAHKVLIQALVLNGLEEEAGRVAARFLEMAPTYTLAYQKKLTPYRDQVYARQVITALRRAGLPE
jgi:adenylate cyclase